MTTLPFAPALRRLLAAAVVAGVLVATVRLAAQIAFGNEQILTPSAPPVPYQGAGSSVAISGALAVVGAPYGSAATIAGSAHVYAFNGATWNYEATLLANEPDDDGQFGLNVAIDGETVLVAAPYTQLSQFGAGAVYVFERSGGQWTQTAKIEAATDFGASAHTGMGIAISGDTAVASNYSNTDAGRLLVVSRVNGVWDVAGQTVVSPILPQNASLFGWRVAIEGDTIAASATGVGAGAGNVQTFDRNGMGVWVASAFLAPAGMASGDGFGASVAVNGNQLVVGAPFQSGSGAVYVFAKNGAAWTDNPQFWTRLPSKNPQPDDYFGAAVGNSGGNVIVAAPGRKNWRGSVVSFDDLTGTAYGSENQAGDGAPGDQFGWSASLAGTRAVVGANVKDFPIGGAYAFDVTSVLSSPRIHWTFTLWPYKYIYMGCPLSLLKDTSATIDMESGRVRLLFSIGQAPRHGTLQFRGPTHVVYQPERGFVGRDTFSIMIADRAGNVLEKTVSVSVLDTSRR